MSRRKTVGINLEIVQPKIKSKFRNYTIFCEAMGRGSYWVPGWKQGKNLPSPEEAARMCVLLQTTPEEILLHSGPTEEKTQKCLEDIEEVKRLIEVERGRNVKKETPGPKAEGFDRIQQFVGAASKEEIAELHRFIDFLESKRGKDETKS